MLGSCQIHEGKLTGSHRGLSLRVVTGTGRLSCRQHIGRKDILHIDRIAGDGRSLMGIDLFNGRFNIFRRISSNILSGGQGTKIEGCQGFHFIVAGIEANRLTDHRKFLRLIGIGDDILID